MIRRLRAGRPAPKLTHLARRARTATLLLTPVVLLTACTPEGQNVVARETAKSVINPILAQRFPGLPLAPISNCVVDNATGPEIVTLASAAVTGVKPTTTQTTLLILQRPGTVNCIANDGLAGILGGQA